VAGLLVIVADAAQTTVNCRDGVAINQIDDVTQNFFWGGGQGAPFVVIAPGTEVFPVGGVGIEGVFGVTVGNVGTRSRQKIFDRRGVNRRCQS
jgi:hypothetical protein